MQGVDHNSVYLSDRGHYVRSAAKYCLLPGVVQRLRRFLTFTSFVPVLVAKLFFVLGLIAGLFGVLGAEALLLSLQHFVFNQVVSPHYSLWLLGPFSGAVLISCLGLLACRNVVTTPPNVVLRSVM